MTVDVVIFTVREGELEVLLVGRPRTRPEPFPGLWALPGGFVDTRLDQDLEACALRKLKDKTGVTAPYLEQLGSWGGAGRDPRGWSVSTVYFSLVPGDGVVLEKGANAAAVQWFPVRGDRVDPPLAFDHGELLQAAIRRLRGKVEYTSLPAYLLAREFTLSELQRVYEIVLGRKLEKSAFRTRVLAAGMIAEVAKMREGPNRPARLYRLAEPGELVYFPRTFNPPRE